MSKIDGDWSFSASLEGDFNFGNIELIQFGTATQLAKRNRPSSYKRAIQLRIYL